MDALATISPGPGFERRTGATVRPEASPRARRSRAAFVARLVDHGLTEGRALALALDAAPLARALDEAGFEASGMDHAPEAPIVVEAHGEVGDEAPWPIRLGDASAHIPWPNGTFDAVVLLDVLEHVRDDFGVVHEVRRVLRPGGVALIGSKNAGGLGARLLGSRWSPRRDARKPRLYDVPALVALFGYQGFRIKRWGTYFDLQRASESSRAIAWLARVGVTAPGLGVGEHAALIVEKPLLEVPAWNDRRRP